mmetsp:Transcript_19446/g.32689  ORF Transcript_19446/g.32689 Transcript_19446/m.32689 type:complete len:218 (+) Transcript_19446:1190-1843(+)
MQEANSSSFGGRPPRFRSCAAMNTALYAFSLAHDPHIMSCTQGSPFGATLKIVDFTRSIQPAGGILPSAGRCASRERLPGFWNTSSICGLLYPTGSDAMWLYKSSRRLPSTSTTKFPLLFSKSTKYFTALESWNSCISAIRARDFGPGTSVCNAGLAGSPLGNSGIGDEGGGGIPASPRTTRCWAARYRLPFPLRKKVLRNIVCSNFEATLWALWEW